MSAYRCGPCIADQHERCEGHDICRCQCPPQLKRVYHEALSPSDQSPCVAVGHNYVETETCDHAFVQVLTCDTCGHVSIGWQATKPVPQPDRGGANPEASSEQGNFRVVVRRLVAVINSQNEAIVAASRALQDAWLGLKAVSCSTCHRMRPSVDGVSCLDCQITSLKTGFDQMSQERDRILRDRTDCLEALQDMLDWAEEEHGLDADTGATGARAHRAMRWYAARDATLKGRASS